MADWIREKYFDETVHNKVFVTKESSYLNSSMGVFHLKENDGLQVCYLSDKQFIHLFNKLTPSLIVMLLKQGQACTGQAKVLWVAWSWTSNYDMA